MSDRELRDVARAILRELDNTFPAPPASWGRLREVLERPEPTLARAATAGARAAWRVGSWLVDRAEELERRA